MHGKLCSFLAGPHSSDHSRSEDHPSSPALQDGLPRIILAELQRLPSARSFPPILGSKRDRACGAEPARETARQVAAPRAMTRRQTRPATCVAALARRTAPPSRRQRRRTACGSLLTAPQLPAACGPACSASMQLTSAGAACWAAASACRCPSPSRIPCWPTQRQRSSSEAVCEPPSRPRSRCHPTPPCY